MRVAGANDIALASAEPRSNVLPGCFGQPPISGSDSDLIEETGSQAPEEAVDCQDFDDQESEIECELK